MANWFARGMGVVLNLVLIPILFRKLPSQELGIWFLLGQSWTVIGFFDFGFASIFSRKVAFALESGSREASIAQSREAVISQLFATCHVLNRWLAVFAFVVSLISGAIYLGKLDLVEVNRMSAWAAWSVLCLARAVAIWSSTWASLLRGLGYVGWDTVLGALVNAAILTGQAVCVWLGGGLVALAIVAGVGAVTQRWLVTRFIRRRCSALNLERGRWDSGCFRSMLPFALRGWITSLGYLLLAATDQFFVTSYKGASALPAYRAAFILSINLHLLAGVFSGAAPLFVSRLWRSGELGQIRSILKRNAQIGLFSMACGSATILCLGPTLFDVWLGPGNFIGYPVLGIFLATFVLEHHANVFSTCSRATNDEAYAIWSVAAGIIKVILALVLMRRFGLAGLALSTLLAQGLTTDWFMVYRSGIRLAVDYEAHVRQVVIPFFSVLATASAIAATVNALTSAQPAGIRLPAVVFSALVTLAGSVWLVILRPADRACVLKTIGSLTSKHCIALVRR